MIYVSWSSKEREFNELKNRNLYKQRKTNKKYTWHKNILNSPILIFI